MVGLMVLDDDTPMSETGHLVLLAAIAVLICVLAVAWAERNHELVEREGADALVAYRPLPGTLEAMDPEAASPEQRRVVSSTFISEYDPLSCPPISHSRSEEVAEESSQ